MSSPHVISPCHLTSSLHVISSCHLPMSSHVISSCHLLMSSPHVISRHLFMSSLHVVSPCHLPMSSLISSPHIFPPCHLTSSLHVISSCRLPMSSPHVISHIISPYLSPMSSPHLQISSPHVRCPCPPVCPTLSHVVQILAELRRKTATMIGKEMQVSPEQGAFLAMLVRLMGARRCIELGVYTGYSSLSVALALPADGLLVACERVPHTFAVAQRFYEKAGVKHKVDPRLGPAQDTLQQLLEEGQAGSFDFAFLDADKRMYQEYYELLLTLLRPGGLLVVDNVLWHGQLADPQVTDRKTEYLRAFNKFIRDDPRIHHSIVPVGDGVALCQKL
ncbi:unnamed protein product [Closterium sp. NIES-54]